LQDEINYMNLTTETIFETERLVVRYFTATDYDNYFGLQGDPRVMKYIRTARTRQESDTFLTEKILPSSKEDFRGYWAVQLKDSRIFVGCFVIIPMPDDVAKTQMGYSFLPEHWGKGYATEVARHGVTYFYNCTPLEEIYGVTESENIASQKVLTKVGFTYHRSKREEGKELFEFILQRK
jgi:[ribosomal protein S5]-alanine N-acetyltransferase